ncbi:MAG: hypothetical protein K8R59_03725 [Thermoanaerobaculales bacterium]|nr:hypothetical protein [Thermoanaerobaculales bacterium]
MNDSFTLVSVRIPKAQQLDAPHFRHLTKAAYDSVFDAIGSSHLVRVWNFIPGILEPLGNLPQRYMEFNGARHEAYAGRYNGSDTFSERVATASGVGSTGDDFELHALATIKGGQAVENPRQKSSYQYSRSYGPLPPCFARATRLGEPAVSSARLLVGGTASIRGETTIHLGDLESQTQETLLNLAAVVSSGLDAPNLDFEDPETRRSLLSRYRHLRVYYTRPDDFDTVSKQVVEAFHGAERIELARADLCREGLLIEIEGWADLGE